MKEQTKLLVMLAVFGTAWFLPVDDAHFMGAVRESLKLLRWYTQEHVLLCLVPALFIAGAISVFVSQGAVMKYLGPSANKFVAYPVAAVSGSILAVCSCTVLPLFASIHKRGAGLGPALSLPDMLVIRSVIGTKKTLVFTGLVVSLSTIAGVFTDQFFKHGRVLPFDRGDRKNGNQSTGNRLCEMREAVQEN